MVSTRQRSRRQDDEDDPAFSTLPAGLRHSIDEAFDTCAVPRKQAFTQQNDNELDAPGGFIIDSATVHAGEEPGGFLVVSESSTSRVQGSDVPGDDFYIPLPSIPRTLRLLDLESDDEVLGVFRNAASGWGAGNADNEGVNRKDWRAICATLLEGQEGIALGSEETGVVEMEEDSGSEGDEYQMSVLSSEQEESSDEYHDDISGTAKSNQATSGSRKPSSKFPTSNSDAVHLTTEQRAICKEDFARFFPAVPGAQLDGQRITAHEIMQAALLLKESLKPEEVVEMLQAFSSSKDGSMSFEDFERMMAQTRMIRS